MTIGTFFAKPTSPMLLMFWNWITGKEEVDPYGGMQNPYGGPGAY